MEQDGDKPESSPQTEPGEGSALPKRVRETIVMAKARDERGWYSRELHAEEDGTLTIEGHDLGSGVSNFWGDGMTEYEFTRTLSVAAVAQLRLSLGIDDTQLLEILRSRFETTHALEEYLEANGIETTFWSRVGD